MEYRDNLIAQYVRFCQNSKIHKVSKLQINPTKKDGGPTLVAMDMFKYPDTAIRRIRRFIKFLGLNIDFAVIPRSRSIWEDSFSLWNDVKYSTKLNESETEKLPTCRIVIDGVEVATVTDLNNDALMAIDLTALEVLLEEKYE